MSGQAGWMDQPLRIPLVVDFSSRDGTLNFDGYMKNCYAEFDKTDQGYWIEKRFGLSLAVSRLGGGNGGYFWQKTPTTGDYYYIAGGSFYSGSAGLITNLTLPVTNIFRFEKIRGNPSPYVVFGDGSNAYYYDGTTVTNIHTHDADFPASFVPGWAYLDGTLYVMTPSGAIQGSAIDDPTSWDPLNVIQANLSSDFGVFLLKHLTYVVALKQTSLQAFYDAGNPTGSPLLPVDGSYRPYGCIHPNTVQEFDGANIWVTYNQTVSPQVVRMDNLQITVVSTPAVERVLDGIINGVTWNSFIIKHSGHRFYGVTGGSMKFSLVYDIDQQIWYVWTNAAGTAAWNPVSMFYDNIGNHLAQDGPTGSVYFTDADFNIPTDLGVAPPVDVVTNNFDGGIDRIKTLPAMRFNASQVKGSVLQVRVNDNDYDPAQWSNFRPVNLQNQRPVLDNMASFYRRSFHLHHQTGTSFRLKSADLTMDVGTQ